MKAIKLKPTLNGVVLNTEEKKSIIGGLEGLTSSEICIYNCKCQRGTIQTSAIVKANSLSGAVYGAYNAECSSFLWFEITCSARYNTSGLPCNH